MTQQDISHCGRVEAQTVREWIYEYSEEKPVWPSALGEAPAGYISVPDSFNPKLNELTGSQHEARKWFRL